MANRLITFTTDFGLSDHFVGTMKGVVAGIAPQSRVIDISHGVSPYNVTEAAFVIAEAWTYFPKGTIHVVVVDPGVGSSRRPILAEAGGHFFIAPDNGVLSLVFDAATHKVRMITNPKFMRREISRTFHGRDIFAPVGAALANGVPLADLGPTISDPIRLSMPKPEKTPTGWRAHVTVVDIFGNLTTDLPASELEGQESVLFRLLGQELRGLVDSYGHEQPGALVALVDSENFVEIAAVNGSAAKVLGAQIGDIVEVVFNS
jgi:S-adenosyl-L-methionine hydrolase (adenosine-forming)